MLTTSKAHRRVCIVNAASCSALGTTSTTTPSALGTKAIGKLCFCNMWCEIKNIKLVLWRLYCLVLRDTRLALLCCGVNDAVEFAIIQLYSTPLYREGHYVCTTCTAVLPHTPCLSPASGILDCESPFHKPTHLQYISQCLYYVVAVWTRLYMSLLRAWQT